MGVTLNLTDDEAETLYDLVVLETSHASAYDTSDYQLALESVECKIESSLFASNSERGSE